ncbi:uncharacterized protein LOC142608871 [Castanea sativa]|uniref:uncharacterized protein LOC142608871 n=1 Tax=Castanea sativa TaxID=21020 RepID=UPI003F649B18
MASSETDAPSNSHNMQSTHANTNSNSESNAPNPYFLSSNENPGNIFVTQPLLGMRNYHSWSRAMVLALTTKKKIGFINGKLPMPDVDSPLYEDWQSCNTMVLSWLINSMHVDVSSSIMYCETAKEMWLDLKHLFSQGNGPKIYNLQREISHISHNQMTVTEYYTKFKRLWNQLLNFEPFLECSCGATKILSASHDKAYVMMEKSHKNIGHGVAGSSQSDAMAMFTNSKGNSNSNWNKGNGKKERAFCTHCNMQGHTIEKCYKLHGYPLGYKPKGKSGANVSGNQASCNSVNGANKALVTASQCSISKAQCEQLLAFLNSRSTNLGAVLGDALHVASVSSS